MPAESAEPMVLPMRPPRAATLVAPCPEGPQKTPSEGRWPAWFWKDGMTGAKRSERLCAAPPLQLAPRIGWLESPTLEK